MATADSHVVLPEILTFSGDEVLLVHGSEGEQQFWWPPGAYWLAEKACNLTSEQPDAWVARVLRSQINATPSEVRLCSVEFIDRSHPPVLIYEAQLTSQPRPSSAHGFDQARYFPITALPEQLGRDRQHGDWLRTLLLKR